MIERGPDGKFRRLPDEDTFVTISNEQIFKRIETMDDRLGVIESHLLWSKRMATTLATTLSTGAAVLTAVWYVRH